MKKLLLIFAGALLFVNLFLSTGCGDDPIVNDLGPLVQITDGPLPGEIIAGQGDVTVTVTVTKGTAQLKSLTILEDGTKVNASRISITGITAANNPQLITGTDKDGLTWDIKIKSHTDFTKKTYTILVDDDGSKSDEATFDLEVVEPTEMTILGVLWNQAGPVGKGGIDLDNGTSTGTKLSSGGNDSYLQAELRDMGIDSSQTNSAIEWRQQIGPINGTEVRFISASNGDFDFDKINSKQGIADAFAAGAALDNTVINTTGWPASYKVTAPIQKNDILVVKKGSERTYLVRIDEVIISNVTPDDNDDRYEVSIKY
jgi:hypothetical protein